MVGILYQTLYGGGVHQGPSGPEADNQLQGHGLVFSILALRVSRSDGSGRRCAIRGIRLFARCVSALSSVSFARHALSSNLRDDLFV